MICKHCGAIVKDGLLTCENCGAYLGSLGMEDARPSQSGASSIRQGRGGSRAGSGSVSELSGMGYGSRVTVADDIGYTAASAGASRPEMHTGSFRPLDEMDADTIDEDGFCRVSHRSYEPLKASHELHKRKTNWTLLIVIAGILVIGAFAAYKIYMAKSDDGMSRTARSNTLSATEDLLELAVSGNLLVSDEKEELLEKWNEAEPRIYWMVADDYLSVGDVETAITCYRIARILEEASEQPDADRLRSGLMDLASAYELNNQDDKAEEIYLELIADTSYSNENVYSALISLYQENDRRSEAADMMEAAYNQTKNINFYLERTDYIPSTPQINLESGRYEINESGLREVTTEVNGSAVPLNQIILYSPQGYDIYYTLDEKASLPEEGIRYTDGIRITEGTMEIRAVCMSETLSSDEISVSYTFFYPTPPAPKCSLAPGTYNKKMSVTLRAGEITDEDMTKKEKAEAEKYYTYYYTIDGSTPDTNSPMYDGTPIALPSGRVTLQAICVNQYGKSSSVLTIGYKFTVKPYLADFYSEEDQFTGFVLNKTVLSDFTSNFGSPNETLTTKYLNLENDAQHLVYDWGYAVFILDGSKWVLVRVEMTSGFTSMPRGIKLGATESEVCAAYKDYGQPVSQDGTRGLYYSYPKVGKILIRQDGTRVIQYTLETAASNSWVLQYWLNDHGTVNKICHYYQP